MNEIPPPAQPPHEPEVTEAERQWAMFTHLSALLVFVSGIGILAPIVLWALKKNESAYIDYHGKEAVNFNLTACIVFGICVVLMLALIGLPMFFAYGLFWVVMVVIASLRSNEGVMYRYPLTIRFLK